MVKLKLKKKKRKAKIQPRNHLWEGNRGSRCHGHMGRHWLLVMFRFLGCMLGLWLFIMLCFTTSFILQSSVCITYVVLMYYKNNKGKWNNKPKSRVLTLSMFFMRQICFLSKGRTKSTVMQRWGVGAENWASVPVCSGSQVWLQIKALKDNHRCASGECRQERGILGKWALTD